MAALYSIQEQWRVTVTNNTNLIQTERRTTRETDLKIQVKTEDTFFSSGWVNSIHLTPQTTAYK